jgi:hypothetical protein
MFKAVSIAALRGVAARLVHSWRCDQYANAVAAELDAHVALLTADNMRRGLGPVEARREALLRLGGVQQTRERCFDAMTFRWIVRHRAANSDTHSPRSGTKTALDDAAAGLRHRLRASMR